MAEPQAPLKPSPARGWSAYQWGIVLLLLFGLVLSAIDKVNLAVTGPYWIKHHLFTAPQVGLLQAILGWSLTFFLLIAGPLVDRYHPRVVLPIGMLLTSLGTWVTGMVTSLGVLQVVRGVVGMGQAALFPSAPRLIVENIEDQDRSKAISIYFAGNKVGPTVGIPLASFFLLALGWRGVFYATGALGAIWLILWFAIYRRNKAPIAAPVEASAKEQHVSWGHLFAYRTTWALIFGQFGYLYVLYVFLTWLPGYLVLQQHLGTALSGALGSLPFIISIVTTLFGGWLADFWIVKSRGNKTLVRKTIVGGGLFLSTVFIIIAAFSHAVLPAMIFLSLTMAAMGMVTGSVNALPMDLAPRAIVSSLSSLQNFGGNLGGAFAPLITGLLLAKTHSFQVPLIVTGLVALVFGVGSYVLLMGEVRPTYTVPASKS